MDIVARGSIPNALLKKESLSLRVALGKIEENSRGLAKPKYVYREVSPNQTTRDHEHRYKGYVPHHSYSQREIFLFLFEVSVHTKTN